MESRRAVRKEITLKGSFMIKDDLKYKLHVYKEPIDLTLVDIAVLGCGIVASHYLPKGLVIALKIKDFPVVSGKEIKERKDIEFSGRVMTCKTTPSRANKIGLEFVDLNKEDRDLIKGFVMSDA